MDICNVSSEVRSGPREIKMGLPSSICTFLLALMVVVRTGGQINRYINPAWLEMDANSEYYPGGEVINRILQAYGLGDAPSRYRSSVLDRGGYGRSSYPRNRIVNGLNNAYDSDPLTQEYLDRNYDYADNTIRGSNRYRNTLLLDGPRRNRVNLVSAPRTSYYPSEYTDRDLPLYTRSRSAIDDPALTQEELLLRGRGTARLVPRSTTAPDTSDKRKM